MEKTLAHRKEKFTLKDCFYGSYWFHEFATAAERQSAYMTKETEHLDVAYLDQQMIRTLDNFSHICGTGEMDGYLLVGTPAAILKIVAGTPNMIVELTTEARAWPGLKMRFPKDLADPTIYPKGMGLIWELRNSRSGVASIGVGQFEYASEGIPASQWPEMRPPIGDVQMTALLEGDLGLYMRRSDPPSGHISISVEADRHVVVDECGGFQIEIPADIGNQGCGCSRQTFHLNSDHLMHIDDLMNGTQGAVMDVYRAGQPVRFRKKGWDIWVSPIMV